MEDPTNGKPFMQDLSKALRALSWPQDVLPKEDKFNKECLKTYLKSSHALREIKGIDQSSRRRNDARPFFGWGAIESSRALSIDNRVKTDGIFMIGESAFFVENKIIRDRRECDVKNSLVQVVEYLNLYDVNAGVLLILDDGRGANQTWKDGSEKRLLDLMTDSYPMCVARIRKNLEAEVFPFCS